MFLQQNCNTPSCICSVVDTCLNIFKPNKNFELQHAHKKYGILYTHHVEVSRQADLKSDPTAEIMTNAFAGGNAEFPSSLSL